MATPAQAAHRSAPPIPGLVLLPDLLPAAVSGALLDDVAAARYFDAGAGRDQVMLFARAGAALPLWAANMLDSVAYLCRERLEPGLWTLLFDAASLDWRTDGAGHEAFDADATKESDQYGTVKARQLILNLYAPGTGISAHIDLPARFGDGILALSLGSGCVMDFVRGSEQHALWLPPNSGLVLSGEARWEWSHGIAARDGDWVRSEGAEEAQDDLWGSDDEGEQPPAARVTYVPRGGRLSITCRWLKPGADIVGAAEGEMQI